MSITSANAILMLSQATLFPSPVQIQGFAADDVYDVDEIKSVETIMGVDGVMSAGFVYEMVQQRMTLQADSASVSFFDTIWTQMNAAQDTYELQGLITLPGIATKFQHIKGFLTGWPPMPNAKRTLQPRRFSLIWQRILPSPI